MNPSNNNTKPYKSGEFNTIKTLKSNLASGNNSTSNSKNGYNYNNYYSMYNNNNSNYGFNYSQTPQNGKNKTNNYNVSNFNSNDNVSSKYYNDNKSNGKEEYHDFKVDLINIITGKDKRTTIMLRNIPNKYTLQNLVDEINSLFLGKYDYINLPIDYEVFKIRSLIYFIIYIFFKFE